MNLEKKLKHLCDLYGVNKPHQEQAVADIEKAFIDVGWLDPTKVESVVMRNVETVTEQEWIGPDSIRTYKIEPPEIEYDKPGKVFGEPITLLTGQEWLTRFEKELGGMETIEANVFFKFDALPAARRASGLDTSVSEEKSDA